MVEMIRLGAFFMAMAFAITAKFSHPLADRMRHQGASTFHFRSLIFAAVAWAGFAAFAWLPDAFLGHNEYGALIRIDLVFIFLVLFCTTIVSIVSVIYFVVAHYRQFHGPRQTG